MPGETPAQALFRRIQSGDRTAAAEFVLQYEPQIRRRIRGKLGRRLRRLFDTQDILSTLLRRLDVLILGHHLRAQSEEQMWSLVMRIAETAVLEKGRMMHRLKRRDDLDPDLAEQMSSRLTSAAEEDDFDVQMTAVFDLVENGTDRQILWMWLAGYEHPVTARVLGISHDAVRKRWERVKTHIRIGMREQVGS